MTYHKAGKILVKVIQPTWTYKWVGIESLFLAVKVISQNLVGHSWEYIVKKKGHLSIQFSLPAFILAKNVYWNNPSAKLSCHGQGFLKIEHIQQFADFCNHDWLRKWCFPPSLVLLPSLKNSRILKQSNRGRVCWVVKCLNCQSQKWFYQFQEISIPVISFNQQKN